MNQLLLTVNNNLAVREYGRKIKSFAQAFSKACAVGARVRL